VSGDERIFLWDAGPASGTAGSAERAFEKAVPYLGGTEDVTVKEAVIEMVPAGPAGSVPEYRRTGRAWRGCLAGGEPTWSEVASQAGEALAGEVA
jgi:hypothetical protein